MCIYPLRDAACSSPASTASASPTLGSVSEHFVDCNGEGFRRRHTHVDRPLKRWSLAATATPSRGPTAAAAAHVHMATKARAATSMPSLRVRQNGKQLMPFCTLKAMLRRQYQCGRSALVGTTRRGPAICSYCSTSDRSRAPALRHAHRTSSAFMSSSLPQAAPAFLSELH